jgi:multidrug efflux system membrane fusion protein
MGFEDSTSATARSRWHSTGAVLLVALSAVSVSGCSGNAAGAPAAATGRAGGPGAAVAVKTAVAAVKPMPVTLRVVGNVEPAATVAVRAQVAGELLTVHFTEGAEVQKGDLLFTIDPRPFDGALRQAEAALARNRAQLANAEAQLTRSTDLLGRGLVAASQHDVIVAQAAALRATVDADTAQVQTARVQLQHTRIVAPMAGRTGALLVHPGAVIRTGEAAPLVVINQVAPIQVSFAVPARLLPTLRRRSGQASLPVLAAPAGSQEAPATGTVSFFDNAVDPATDTIRVKATFPNRDGLLWPGAFVDVTLQQSIEPNAVVVPNAAVQASQAGQMVFVVKADQTVEVRPVTVGWTDGGDSVIATGLTAGEVVVTDGHLRLTPGARVDVSSDTQP